MTLECPSLEKQAWAKYFGNFFKIGVSNKLFCVSLNNYKNLSSPTYCQRFSHTARIPSPLPLHVAKTGRKSFERGIYPPPPHWDRREILAKPHQLR
jgi:hypothetical protein